eukprot:m.53192 g.53192  ORF g.53192 m.53192 type:complete len:644 (+) comp18366_c0_seq1:249-2180(+)
MGVGVMVARASHGLGLALPPDVHLLPTNPPAPIQCFNSSHFYRQGTLESCPSQTQCLANVCQGDLEMHLARSAFIQDASLFGQPSELNNCSSNPMEDVRAGRVLCDVYHAAAQTQPGILHELGNTWMTFYPTPTDPCLQNVTTWRRCTSKWLRNVATLLRSVAPSALFSGGLMEFLHRNNLDDPSQFEEACLTGTIGKWGDGNNTCVPDIANSFVARKYYIAMGKVFIDANITVFLFGQARLTGGNDGTSSAVSQAGAKGFQYVIDELRAYAKTTTSSPLYFGAQAACCVQTEPGGESLIQWVYGAQHMQPVAAGSQQIMVQPLSRASAFFLEPQQNPPWKWLYGDKDWHDANLVNNQNELPVVLDFDNWSGDPDLPDDIRTLACLSNSSARSQAVSDKFYHLNNYNPRAFVSVPLSKVMSSLIAPAPYTNAKCYGNQSSNHPPYFSANACGIIGIAKKIFALPFLKDNPPSPTTLLSNSSKPVSRVYFGQQLRSPDATVAWLYRSILNRTVELSGYTTSLSALPQIQVPGGQPGTTEANNLNRAAGPRAQLVLRLIRSAEFNATFGCESDTNLPGQVYPSLACATEIVTRSFRAIMLADADTPIIDPFAEKLHTGNSSILEIVDAFSGQADAEHLYSSPAAG